MKTSQLKHALLFHPSTKDVYGGVFARNRVPTIPKRQRIAYVVNTDPAHKPGQHWIAFFLTRDTIYYFDPYGTSPSGFTRILRSRKRKRYFGRRIQGTGRMCGHYCLYFILAMQTHQSFRIFGSDLDTNDRIVKQFVETHFPHVT